MGLSAVIVGPLVLACGSELASVSGPTPTAAASFAGPTTVVWSADHETGDLSQWYTGDGGGEFNSGAASSTVSQDVAHSGRFSMKGTIATPGASGVRLFRWSESRAHREARYSAWFYFPRTYRPQSWWNIFQFKSRNGSTENDPFWFLQIGNRAGGAMYLFLNWWEGLAIEGPHRGQFGGRRFMQGMKDVPVARWTHIEIFLRQSSDFDGQIIVWQDGVELFNVANVRTRYPAPNGANEWSIANYSDGITPSPTTLYVDDAVISASLP
jgi:hypothetical protein